MKRFAASTWPDTEEICVVSHLYFTFLSCNVDAHRKSLTVGVEGGERRVLTFFQMLLEEEA